MKQWKRLTALLLAVLLLCGCGAGGATQKPDAENEISAPAETAAPGAQAAAADPAQSETAPETDLTLSENGGGDPASGETEDLFALYSTARPERQSCVEETVTLMLYMVGSDLESNGASATNDLNEMLAAGVDLSRVNLLVLTGGAAKWHSDVPADAIALLRLTENGFETLETYALSSMGDPENLTRLLDYGYGYFPADSYALILWDHGNGPVMGFGSDKNFGNDALTLPELRTALESSPFGKENKLSFIGFDACLMASAELAITLADYADLLISSQETEPGYGWDYSFLAELGTTAAETLACDIVDAFVAFSKEYNATHPFGCGDVTLSVTDLRAAEALETALNDLFTAAAEDVSLHFSTLAAGRVKTRSLGRASTGSEYDLADLGSLMKIMGERYPAEAACVTAILEKMVLYSGSNAAETCGLSLYYPCFNKKYFQKSWQAGYEELELLPAYREYLRRYTAYWLASDLSSFFKGRLTASAGANGTYALQLTPEQEEVFASAGYYILQRYSESTYTPVYYSSNVTNSNGLLEADFDGSVLYCCNDYGQSFIPVTVAHDTVDGVANYSVVGYFSDTYSIMGDTSRCRIQLALEEATGKVTIKSITEITDNSELQTGKQQEADFSEYPVISFFYPSPRYLGRDEAGRIQPFFDWQATGSLNGWMVSVLNGLDFRLQPLYDDGSEYYILFEITDVTGASYSSELLPVTLAEAPAPEPVVYIELPMADSGTAVLYEDGEVSVRLTVSENPETGRAEIDCFCSNGSDHIVAVEFLSCGVNGTVSAGEANLWADPGEDYRSRCYDWNEACLYAGIDMPESLEFTLHIYYADNGKILMYETPIRLVFPADFTPVLHWKPACGALAEEQELGTAAGCVITLLAMGEPLTQLGNGITLQLKAENTTTEEAKAVVEAIRLNGVVYPVSETMQIKPGCSSVRMTTVNPTERMQLFGISEISSMALWLNVTAGEETQSGWYEIELSEKGGTASVEPEGILLYEDEELVIKLINCGSGYDCHWYLEVNNRGDRMLHTWGEGTASDGRSVKTYYQNLYPDSRNILYAYCSGSEVPEYAELEIFFNEESWDVSGSKTTGVLTIPYDEEVGQ